MFYGLKLAMTLISFLALFVVLPATAGPLSDGIAALASKSFKGKIAAIRALGSRGNADAVRALEALKDGKLFRRKADGKVVIADRKGALYVLSDPVSGEKIGASEKRALKKIRVNNRLRGIIRDVLGRLTLGHPDPAKRIAAADVIFKSKSAESLALIATALQAEKIPSVTERLQRAHAAVTLATTKDQAKRRAALKQLSDFIDPEVRAVLTVIIADPGDPLVSDATKILVLVEERLLFWSIVGNIFHGISLGSVLLLAAVGLAITFGVMGVINMAHGELVMIGAYTTFVVQEVFRALAPEAFAFSLFVAVPAAFLVSGAFGVLMERSIMRFLYGRPLETLLASWGVSLVLQQLVRSIFGPTNQDVSTPAWMSGAIETGSGLVLTYNRITIIIFSLLLVAVIALIMRKTIFGLQVRAVTQNRKMAQSMGIRTGWIDAMTFGLGAGIAGIAGVALSQIDNVSPNLGQAYIVDSFMVVVFGGVGNLWGTVVGAFSLGIANKFLEPYAGAVLAKILVLVVIILFIQKRPRGLFALKGRAVEA